VPRTQTPISGATKTKTTPESDFSVEGGPLLTSAALIAAGLLIEPELVGGALLGAGVVYGLPLAGRILRPVLKTAVMIGYSAATSVSEVVAGAGEGFKSMVAQARDQHERVGAPGSAD
jgi:hypothetical protein